MLVFWLKVVCTIRRAQTGLVTVSGERIERQAVVVVLEALFLVEALVEVVEFVFRRRDVLLWLFERIGLV